MLRLLRVRNLAVIESVDVAFEPGFNVLTGETGAGKSILVEAIGLLLGGRASADLVRTGERVTTIEAHLADADGEVVLRREITAQGRSRAFIDGVAVTSAALRERCSRSVELHGQHEHQRLLDSSTHLPLLDAFAGVGELAADVRKAWVAVREAREAVGRTHMDARERAARLDLIAFQLGEIRGVRPTAGEDDALSSERRVLADAERVRRLCDEAYGALYDDEHAVLTQLSGVWKRVAELDSIEPAFEAFASGRDSIKAQLEELAALLRATAARAESSPERLRDVEDRLVALERLRRKYGPTLGDVLERETALSRDADLLRDASGDGAEAAARRVVEAEAAYHQVAGELSARRRDAAPEFSRRLEGLVRELALDGARFEMRFAAVDDADAGEHGVDVAELYASLNRGEDLRPLARIASGGELSRVMLALKTLSFADSGSATLVFDEVDAGIGGRVADVVGERLRELGGRFQVLCITHLAQIAARGTSHFQITKRVDRGRTRTLVARLAGEARVVEIARMIGGATQSDAVRATARDLLAGGAPGNGRRKAKGESESPWRRNI